MTTGDRSYRGLSAQLYAASKAAVSANAIAPRGPRPTWRPNTRRATPNPPCAAWRPKNILKSVYALRSALLVMPLLSFGEEPLQTAIGALSTYRIHPSITDQVG